MTVWEPGAKPWKAQGPPPQLSGRDSQHQSVSVKHLAQALPASAWKDVTWREGTERNLRSRFAALRVRPAGGDHQQAEPSVEEWLLIEWPRGEAEPTKYWLSTLPSHTKLKPLVKAAKQRWIIERDCSTARQRQLAGEPAGASPRSLSPPYWQHSPRDCLFRFQPSRCGHNSRWWPR
jgi:SRSO17 transposase